MLKNTEREFGSVAKFFHWVIALLIIGMLCYGYIMQGIDATNLHQVTGLCILILAAVRIVWRFFNPAPKLPASLLTIEKFAAHTVQALLYLCMFLMPITGWMMSTAYGLIPHIGSFEIPMPGIENDQSFGHMIENIHNTCAVVLIVLICMHVAGALKHHFIDKDPSILRSMLPKFRNDK